MKKLENVIKAWEDTWKQLRKEELAGKKYVDTFLEGYSPKACYPSRKLYEIIKKCFPDYLVPTVSETFHQMTSMCYCNGYANLFKFIIYDELYTEGGAKQQKVIAEKTLIYILMEKHLIEDPFKTYYAGDVVYYMTLNDMLPTDLKYTMDIIKIIRANWKEYFRKVVFPMICAMHEVKEWSELFTNVTRTSWTTVFKRLPYIEDLDSLAVRFLIQDALYYVETSNAQCYNPYWIFGSEHYEDILNEVWKLEVKELECDIYNL